MYYKNITQAGLTVEVHKSHTKRVGVIERNKNSKVTQEQMEQINLLNAERKLRLLINANFVSGDYFLTLTYAGTTPPTPKEAVERIKKLLKQLRKTYKEKGKALKYINVTEYENKRIHHHLIVNQLDNLDIARIICDLWEVGRVNYKFLYKDGNYKKLASYLIKETGKKEQKKEGHKQKWSRSRNLIKPETKTTIVKANTWRDDPKPIKGYYIDKDSIHNGINPFTGKKYQRYIMVKLPEINNVDNVDIINSNNKNKRKNKKNCVDKMWIR